MKKIAILLSLYVTTTLSHAQQLARHRPWAG